MSLAVLWNLIPSNLRNIIYGAVFLSAVALAFMLQSAKIDSLKARLAIAQNNTAGIERAYKTATASLARAYAAANEETAKYHAEQVETIKTVTVYKEKIVHVYEKDPAVHALLDMPLPFDLLDGMCLPFPGSCDYSLPAPAKAASGINGPASAAATASAFSPAVRDLVDNRAELLAWAADARARHAGLVEFLQKTGE